MALGHRTRVIRHRDMERDRKRHLRVVADAAEALPPRPKTRADCLPGGWNEARPCPFAGCRHSLILEVTKTGSLLLNFPDSDDFTDMLDTCSLDAADRGGMTLEEVGLRMSVVRERARQLEAKAMRRAKLANPLVTFVALVPDDVTYPGLRQHYVQGFR